MGGGAPLRRCQSLFLPAEFRLDKGPDIGRVVGIFRDLLIQRPALQLGGGEFGGESCFPLIGIPEGQQRRVKERFSCILLRVGHGHSGRPSEVIAVMDEHLPWGGIAGIQTARHHPGHIPQRRGLRAAQQRQ